MLKQPLSAEGLQSRRLQPGFTLIELMVAVAILGVLLALGMPAYQDWASRSKVRVAGEGLIGGLVTARNQALQRNSQVHFYLTNNLTASCALSNSGQSWVVSMADPAGQCNAAPSDTTDPRIIQSRAGNEGSSRVVIAATNASSAAANRLIFTGLGRIQTTDAGGADTNPIATIDVSYPTGGTCQHAGGTVRCLRVQITTGGEARLCDPAVVDANDPRIC